MKEEKIQITVIHQEIGKGFLLKVKGIDNCFDIFTLLQDELSGSDSRGKLSGPNRTKELSKLQSDFAIWNFAQWSALRINYTVSQLPKYYLWGESHPLDIPKFGDRHIILLGTISLRRGWNRNLQLYENNETNRFIEIEKELSEEEVKLLLKEIVGEISTKECWEYGQPQYQQQIIDNQEDNVLNRLDKNFGTFPKAVKTVSIIILLFSFCGVLLAFLQMNLNNIFFNSLIGAFIGLILGIFGWLNWYTNFR